MKFHRKDILFKTCTSYNVAASTSFPAFGGFVIFFVLPTNEIGGSLEQKNIPNAGRM